MLELHRRRIALLALRWSSSRPAGLQKPQHSAVRQSSGPLQLELDVQPSSSGQGVRRRAVILAGLRTGRVAAHLARRGTSVAVAEHRGIARHPAGGRRRRSRPLVTVVPARGRHRRVDGRAHRRRSVTGTPPMPRGAFPRRPVDWPPRAPAVRIDGPPDDGVDAARRCTRRTVPRHTSEPSVGRKQAWDRRTPRPDRSRRARGLKPAAPDLVRCPARKGAAQNPVHVHRGMSFASSASCAWPSRFAADRRGRGCARVRPRSGSPCPRAFSSRRCRSARSRRRVQRLRRVSDCSAFAS
jgi:hypothetical protein